MAGHACIPKAEPARGAVAVAGGEVAFKRGLNLGNALDAPKEGEWNVTLNERHFRGVAAAKLDHVRLPVRFNAHALSEPPYTLDPRFMARVDWALEQAARHALGVILDFHHYNELIENLAAHTERFVEIWRQVAERYREYPESVAFELLNEPRSPLTPTQVNELYARVIPVVRASNPTRLLIADSFDWASAAALHQLVLAEDPRIMASFHMYQPALFTHQGANWAGPEYATTGIVFPGPPAVPVKPEPAAESLEWVRKWFEGYNTLPSDENPSGYRAVLHQFEVAAAYTKSTGRSVYMGEFGAINKADAASRVRFLRLVRTEAERCGFGWAYWDDGGSFKGLDTATGTWTPEVWRGLFE